MCSKQRTSGGDGVELEDADGIAEARSPQAANETPEARSLQAANEKRLTATHPGGCVWREAIAGFEPVAEGDQVDF